MRQKPLPTLGQRGQQRRRGQAQISHPLAELACYKNTNLSLEDYEEAHRSLLALAELLIKIDQRNHKQPL
jgi:hypothetical protein